MRLMSGVLVRVLALVILNVMLRTVRSRHLIHRCPAMMQWPNFRHTVQGYGVVDLAGARSRVWRGQKGGHHEHYQTSVRGSFDRWQFCGYGKRNGAGSR